MISGTPSDASAFGSALPTSVSASSSFSLRISTCRRTSPISPSVRSGPRSAVRTRPWASTSNARRCPASAASSLGREVACGRARRRGPTWRRRAASSARSHGPGVADRLLPHDPPVSLVVEAVCGRRFGLVPGDREAERLECRQQRGAIRGGARGGQTRVGADSCERLRRSRRRRRPVWARLPRRRRASGGRGRRSPSCGRGPRSELARDDGDDARDRRTTTRKLGTVAPIPQSGRIQLRDEIRPPARPGGKEPLVEREAGEPGRDEPRSPGRRLEDSSGA